MSIFACSKDDGYKPKPIELTNDIVSTELNVAIELDLFSNDLHIPQSSILTLEQPSNGTLNHNNNGTENNLLDDIITYTPNANFTGNDDFEYTICNAQNNDDCAVASVTINVLSNSPVNFDLDNIPYDNLSDYNFFEGELKNLTPTNGVLPYDLISPLFSDYAHKKRFVWMPTNAKAEYVDDHSAFDFPVGTVLIKNFFYENVQPNNDTVIVETRLMYMTEEGWDFACLVAFVYWMSQLKKFNDNNEEDKSVTAHKYL